jgi:hypothetical protein
MSKGLVDLGKRVEALALLSPNLTEHAAEYTDCECWHVINRFQSLSREDMKIRDNNSFTKLVLLNNSLLLQASDPSTRSMSKLDAILKAYPQFTPAWTLKFLQSVADGDYDGLKALLNTYYEKSII